MRRSLRNNFRSRRDITRRRAAGPMCGGNLQMTTQRSGGCVMCQPLQYRPGDVIATGFTYIGRAQAHCFGPQFVVRQSVGADDAKAGKFTMQTLHFIRSRSFQIQHQRFRAMLGDRGTDFSVGVSQINRFKLLGKANRQSLTNSGVVLIEDYTQCFHNIPLTTPQIGGDLGCDSQLLAQTFGVVIDSVESDPSRVLYLRNAFSAGGSNGSACSFPFCFNRISTLPSASSSCFLQVAESCMPSSKSVSDFSRGTSPFSSSWTIFSRRSRHSSNFT